MICEKDLFGRAIINDGNVSSRCEMVKAGDTVVVSIDGGVVFQYELTDRVTMRMVWVEIYEAGLATYKEIAAEIDVSPTTLKTWVKRFRENGLEGLHDKNGTGKTRSIDDQTRKDILKLRAQRKSMNEIARICSCSNASVCNIIKENKAKAPITPVLEGLELEQTNPVSKKEECIDLSDESIITESSTDESIPTKRSLAKDLQKNDELSQILADEPVLLNDELEEIRAIDRSGDRHMATVGKLYDAAPLFASNKHLENAGIFMAFVVLANDSFLKIGMSIFKNIGPAFYGLRTSLLTLITLALLRIKRPEQLLEKNAQKMGLIFGLDRIASVDTIRAKIETLSKSIETVRFMKELGAARAQEYKGNSNIVMVDGHTIGYFGERKVGSTWSARDNRVLHAHTENWVNLPGNAPLFSFETSFNNGLVSSLESVLTQTKEALKTESITAIFDRGGSSALCFETLTEKGFGIITYQKGAYDDIDINKFKEGKIKLGVRDYNYNPYEQEIELKIYEEVDKGEYKKPGRKDTKRTIKMRDIRIICEDGHQISILANKNVELNSEEIADVIFQRIGSQENIFKYMRREFDIDGLASYKFVDVDEEIEHPNPLRKKQEKKINKLNTQRKGLLCKISDNLLFEESKIIKNMIDSISNEIALELINRIKEQNIKIKKKEAIKLFNNTNLSSEMKEKFALKIFKTIKKSSIQTTKELKQVIEEILKQKKLSNKQTLEKLNNMEKSADTIEIKKLNNLIEQEKKLLNDMPIKENANLAGYKKPKPEPKRLTNIIKIAAYAIETKLFDILGKYYKYNANEGRKLIASAMRSTGSLELKPGEIVITLEQQANPRRTKAINDVLRELNAKKAKFPGSARVIRFKETVHKQY